MHRCLTQAIETADMALREDPNAEYVHPGLRGRERIGYMASDTQMTSDEVYLHLPEVDMWGNSSKDLYVALDEGCNTTCHSETWATMAEDKLKLYGLNMPWKSDEDFGAWTHHQDSKDYPICILAQRWRSRAWNHG